MLKFEVFQIQLTKEQIDEVNSSEGQRPAFYEKYLNVTWKPTKEAIAAARDMFSKVAEIEAQNLNQVFEIGNVGPESRITRLAPMHSVSVGDVIVHKGNAFVVAPMGFDRVEF